MAPSTSTNDISDGSDGSGNDTSPDDLTFRQAQTALELTLAQLQASDLDVESMADLYRRGLGYADRCEALLQQVEQEVMQWDPAQPEQPPRPFEP